MTDDRDATDRRLLWAEIDHLRGAVALEREFNEILVDANERYVRRAAAWKRAAKRWRERGVEL